MVKNSTMLTIHAYLRDLTKDAVMAWVAARVPGFAAGAATGDAAGPARHFFDDGRTVILLTSPEEPAYMTELEIMPRTEDSPFAGWDSLQLGTAIVDDLAGAALIDCGGKYTHPLSDELVRVTRERMELVLINEEGTGIEPGTVRLLDPGGPDDRRIRRWAAWFSRGGREVVP